MTNFSVHAPHIHASMHTGQMMSTVMLALIPATVFGFWLYGWSALQIWLVTLVSALLAEALALLLRREKIKPSLLDGSAALTGWLLALSLPPSVPWWVGVIGAIFAILVVKQVFGGLGQNVFNPAMMARVMLLISFPVEMTAWVAPLPDVSSWWGSLAMPWNNLDAVSSASLLGYVKTEFAKGIQLSAALETGHYALDQAMWGWRTGSLGETSALLLALGGGVLIMRRVITWHIPLSMLGGVILPAFFMSYVEPQHYAGPLYHLSQGGLILGAFFIATDPVTSPNTVPGQVLFGLGCGLLTYIIRTWGSYPEGVAFAVLLMNAATPTIDYYIRPRIYGRNRKGEVLLPKSTVNKRTP